MERHQIDAPMWESEATSTERHRMQGPRSQEVRIWSDFDGEASDAGTKESGTDEAWAWSGGICWGPDPEKSSSSSSLMQRRHRVAGDDEVIWEAPRLPSLFSGNPQLHLRSLLLTLIHMLSMGSLLLYVLARHEGWCSSEAMWSSLRMWRKATTDGPKNQLLRLLA
jgi:hypothetical protein